VNGAGWVLGIIGVGGAVFLYLKSQADQQAALDAAKAAPGPGLIDKFKNTLSYAFSKKTLQALPQAPKAAFALPVKGASYITQKFGGAVGGVANSFVGGIKGIF